MSSSSPSSPASSPASLLDETLPHPRPSFLDSPYSSDQENTPPRTQRQPRRSHSGPLRLQNRQCSTQSIPSSGATTPANIFSTPIMGSTNSFSRHESVISFSLGDAVATSFGDTQHGLSAYSSFTNSAIDLPKRISDTPRDSFSSPRTRPLTIACPSADQGTRSRLPRRKLPASTMLSGEIAKPWLDKKDKAARISYFLTYSMLLLGIALAALRCYTGWRSVPLLGKLCLVMEDDFNSDSLDTGNWIFEVDLGGYGNGEFEMTTASSNNSFIRNGELYILPTLTSDVIGQEEIFDGYTFNLTGCTNTNLTACGAVSNATSGTVINPVMSARISTKGKRSIRYGKVEVRAKLPRGDWLWPAIWMLPENNTYGPWPLSGEIDIMESRGNGPAYPAQGINYVRGSLNWGPLTWLNAVSKTYGWWMMRRSTFADTFHTYSLEWSEDFLRVYVDNRLQHMLNLRFDVPFFQRGRFPTTVANASQEIIVPNPWVGRENSAPFDQPFYLILDVAVGGTNGWFPDGAGNKPWLDGALNAMQTFAQAEDKWYKTWPESEDDRAMRIDYVKMWEQC